MSMAGLYPETRKRIRRHAIKLALRREFIRYSRKIAWERAQSLWNQGGGDWEPGPFDRPEESTLLRSPSLHRSMSISREGSTGGSLLGGFSRRQKDEDLVSRNANGAQLENLMEQVTNTPTSTERTLSSGGGIGSGSSRQTSFNSSSSIEFGRISSRSRSSGAEGGQDRISEQGEGSDKRSVESVNIYT